MPEYEGEFNDIKSVKNWNLLERILLRFRLRKSRNRDFDEQRQVLPVIHIFDIEIVLRPVVGCLPFCQRA